VDERGGGPARPSLSLLGSVCGFEKYGMDTQENALLAGALPAAPASAMSRLDPGACSARPSRASRSRASPATTASSTGCRHWLYDGAEPPVQLGDSILGLEIIEAALRSAASGQVSASTRTGRLSPAGAAVVALTLRWSAQARDVPEDPDAALERKWWTLIAVCTAIFMLLLDITVVNVALPDIQKSLHSSFSDLQWVVDAYALTLAAFLLTAGVVGDIFGRREVFAIGLAVFSLASLACGLSTTSLMLNLSRAVQGVGGAIMFATSLALIAAAFSGENAARPLASTGP